MQSSVEASYNTMAVYPAAFRIAALSTKVQFPRCTRAAVPLPGSKLAGETSLQAFGGSTRERCNLSVGLVLNAIPKAAGYPYTAVVSTPWEILDPQILIST